MRRIATCLLAAALAPLVARADMDRWERTGPGAAHRGAFVCPMDDPVDTGNFLCVALSCPPGGVLEWSVSAAGGVGDGPAVTFDLAVDGARLGAVTLDRARDREGNDFSAPYSIGRDAAKLKAMRAGRRAVLTFSGAIEGDLEVPLRGASAAIGHALEACRAR